MSKSFSIFFSVYFFLGSLMPYTDFSQMLSVVEVLEHFADHKSVAKLYDDSICFIEFIHDHVIHHSHDEDSHENMPFHSYNSSFLLILEENHFEIGTQREFFNTPGFINANSMVASDYISAVERPPIFS